MREMKDSGTNYIGLIPTGWNLRRLRFLSQITTGDMDTQDNDPNGSYPFFVRSPIVEHSSKFSFDNEAVLMAGDGVGAGKVFHYIYGKYACHQRVYSISNFHGINGKYLFYYMKELFYKRIEENNAKSTVDSVRLPMLKDFPIAFPNLQEQKKIADYLDSKCSQIDSIIEKQKQIIEKLKEYKTSLITEVVTKGLDPKVEMKDSGIEWIGDIPQNWLLLKLKYNFDLKGRIGWQGLRSDEFIDEGPFLITGTDFVNGYVNWNTCAHISEERYLQDSNIHIKENDLLITKDGTIGKVAIVKYCPSQVSLNSGVAIIRHKGCFPCFSKYFYYILNSNQFDLWFKLSDNGNSTIKHLTQEKFYNFIYTCPSENEQKKIADYLDSKCSQIDISIEKKEQIIDKLREYKKSLIYEVVTGKREV